VAFFLEFIHHGGHGGHGGKARAKKADECKKLQLADVPTKSKLAAADQKQSLRF
jgi:hypothetical protein